MNKFEYLKQVSADYQNSLVLLHAKLLEKTDEFKEIYQDYLDLNIKHENNREKNLNALNQDNKHNLDEIVKKQSRLLGEVHRYNFILEDGETKFGKITPEISKRINELKDVISDYINLEINTTKKKFDDKTLKIEHAFDKLITQNKNNFEIKIDGLLNELRDILQNELASYYSLLNEFAPTKDEYLINEEITTFSATNYTPLVEIGTYCETIEVYGNRFQKNIKVVLPFIDCNSILIIHDNDTAVSADDIHDAIISRTLIANEVGKMKLTFSDLKGMGDFFKEFTPLTHEIVHIDNSKQGLEKILTDCNNRLQDVALKYTSSSKYSSFSTLGEYNFHKISENKIDDIVPNYVSVILNLSYVADENLIKELNRLISNGVNNGTNFIITWNLDEENQNIQLLEKLIANKNIITIDVSSHTVISNQSNYLNVEHVLIPNKIPIEKKHDLVDSYNFQFKEINNRVSKEHFIDKIPQKEHWFNLESAHQISVPIGISKNHRGEQTVDIKTSDFQAHIMLSGGTGSGKTNFLKTFITSASLLYSPKELEFYLIDLKNGIGFDIFRKYQLPHVKMFAMGAENELIFNLLTSLNDEMNHRLNLFAQHGVEDIDKYNQLNSVEKIKRTILIIDEFATIFEQDNNLYQEEIISKISPLAKKARAAGINLFFSTQNFQHVSYGFSNLMSEIPIRIVLKSSLNAASALLDARNDAMQFVKTVGDGLINYQLGVKYTEHDNHLFKTYLLDNKDLEKILEDLKNESNNRGFENNELMVYDNLSQANFLNNHIIKSQNRHKKYHSENVVSSSASKSFPIWLGEKTTLSKEHFKITIERNFNENILISGLYKQISINAIYNIISSLTHNFASGEIAIRFISFLGLEENHELKFNLLDKLNMEYDYKFLSIDDYADELDVLNQELMQRKQNNALQEKNIFLFFVGLEKAQYLFKEDNYSLTKQAAILNSLLESGNHHNIYTICEMRQPSILYKMLESRSINYFKHRILFHLGNSGESEDVIGNKIAGTLYREDLPYTKYRAVYFNTEFEKVFHKFKPYIDLIESNEFYPSDYGSIINNDQIINPYSQMKNMDSENGENKMEEDNSNASNTKLDDLEALFQEVGDETIFNLDNADFLNNGE